MENKTLYSIVALSLIAILGISLVAAMPFGKRNFNKDLSDEEKSELKEKMQEYYDSIENNDYSAWKAIMDEKVAKMQEQITEENFNEIVKKHQEMSEFKTAMIEAKESGDFSKVKELKEQMDFEGKWAGKWHGKTTSDCPLKDSGECPMKKLGDWSGKRFAKNHGDKQFGGCTKDLV